MGSDSKRLPPRASPPRAPERNRALPPLAPKAAKSDPAIAEAQDFRFLRAAPAKTPAVERPSPTESGIQTRIMLPEAAPEEAKRARTVRVAASPRPRLDATIVAKKRIPNKPK